MHLGTSVYVKHICAQKMHKRRHLASFGGGVIYSRYARRTLGCFFGYILLYALALWNSITAHFCLALTCFNGAALRNLGHLERFSKVTPLFLGRGERQVNHLLTPRSYYWHKALALLNFLFGAT